ncbi:MAG: DUF433 domain-containing protein [Phycisphaerales bacterium]|nr:DUF433 domain-containing protein [Phycisphaerales bacterium]
MWQQHIHLDAAILNGKPVIRGTRLAVEFILGLLAQGWSEQQVLENYPGLKTEDIRACLSYAQDRLAIERAYPRSA